MLEWLIAALQRVLIVAAVAVLFTVGKVLGDVAMTISDLRRAGPAGRTGVPDELETGPLWARVA
jgi:hypothetical protein